MRFRTSVTAAFLVLVCASVAIACSVPVFRYALEHWRPDPYVAYVFHDKELTPEQSTLIKTLSPKSVNNQPTINVVVKTIDVSAELEAADQKIWQDHQFGALPSIAVQSPPKWGPPQTIWQSELTADAIASVLDSPVRKAVNKKLVDGETAAWVLLECGNKEEDDKAFTTLTTELKRLEKKLKLPEIETEDLADLSVDPNALKIHFSAVRLSREDPQERAFVEMLLGVESDLRDEEFNSQPMAFPIFGRGRALYALIGKGIAPDVIEEACKFLTAGCQCTVKAQNPGVDLLMNVDWDKVVVPIETLDEDLPPLAGFTGFAETKAEPKDVMEVSAEPEKVAIAAGKGAVADTDDTHTGEAQTATHKSEVTTTTSKDSDTRSTGIGTNVMYLLLLLVAGVFVMTLFFMPKGG